MPEPIVILHLSDLHFGFNRKENRNEDRFLAFRGLKRCLKTLAPEWRPNRLIITGDLGWRGSKGDYQEAEVWLKQIIDLCYFKIKNIFFCPGNHDSNRDIAETIPRPSSAEEADRVLPGKDIPEHFQKPFENYTTFCQSINLPPYRLADQDSYLWLDELKKDEQ